jgi:hypothetical protein
LPLIAGVIFRNLQEPYQVMSHDDQLGQYMEVFVSMLMSACSIPLSISPCTT